ncbi:MAG: tetratricopeptide repeat protein, partial [Acidimicrobiales bacterium]
RARLLLARCRLMFFRSDYDAQTVVAEEAVGEAVAAGRPDLEAQARLWWGKALTWRNDHEAARTMLTVALDMARCGPEPRLVGETLRTLATVAINQSDFRRAGVLIGDALQVHQDDGDAEGETAAIVQLGSVLYNQGRYEEAWTCIEESLPVFVASGYRYRQAIALGNLGGVALAMGRLGPARQRATEALEVCRQLGEKDGSVINLSTLADVHRRSGDQAGAVATVDEALELAAQLNWAYLLGELHLLLAVLASEHGRHDDALREVAVAVEEAGRAATPLLAGRSSFALGRVLLGAGRAEEAAGPLRAAAAAAEELSVAILVTEARAALASALHRVGQVDEAVVLAGQVLDGLDPIAILGGINPGDVYLACSEVLDAAGDPRAEAVRRAAGTFLDEAAARIGDDDLLEGFRGAPVNAALAARLSTVSAPPDPG